MKSKIGEMEVTQKDYLAYKYKDGHEHQWVSALGAPLRCYLCGVGKSIHEGKLMEDGEKWREQQKPMKLRK